MRYQPGVSVTGSGLVYWDAAYRQQDLDGHENIYGMNPDSGLFHAMNRHVALEDFVKLLFVTRMGRLYAGGPGNQYLDASTEAHSIFKMGPPVQREGARIDVASVCDEGLGVYNIGRHFTQAEFQEVAGVATGHEVGHLLVGNWHEDPGHGTLMGDIVFVVVSGGVLVRIDGLDDVEWSDAATGRIDLPNRYSVP